MLDSILLFGMPGGPEVFIILLVVLLLFGAKKIPELARGMGKGIREFKDATKEIKKEIDEGVNATNSTEQKNEKA
ncbi:MAG: sec-independent protein translocase protein TatA [Arenicella sp.]|jgi:sec-independent protein translocase protein TatA